VNKFLAKLEEILIVDTPFKIANEGSFNFHLTPFKSRPAQDVTASWTIVHEQRRLKPEKY
jgi:hypothetical protein